MQELSVVEQIDVGVHFEYMRRGLADRPASSESEDRMARCLDRVATTIAPNPNAVMFFYSAYRGHHQNRLAKHPMVINELAWREEEARLAKFEDLLGPRFFLFGGDERHNRVTLCSELQNRGFTYIPRQTSLTSYGEWAELCVKSIHKSIQRELCFRENNCSTKLDLSLSYENDSTLVGNLAVVKQYLLEASKTN